MSHPFWKQLASAAGAPLKDRQLEQLDRYLDELVAWNEKLNLTRIVDRESAEIRHIADALTLLHYLPRGGGKPISLADVGTGGGVPGVPLAIARPDLRVTLIDSTKKKLDAIDQIIAAVGVPNAVTLHTRMETANQRFDVIVARAVGEMARLLEWTSPLMHRQSVLLAMKGPKAYDEIDAVPMRIRKHFEISTVELSMPELPGHVIVKVKRVQP
jgi:16S rRNA (guanine527-N7)-methyltransferase